MNEQGGAVVELFKEAPDDWRDCARCQGASAVLFFSPTHLETRSERQTREARAKLICSGCVVRLQCLDFALRVGEAHGIWGGLTEAERRRLAVKAG